MTIQEAGRKLTTDLQKIYEKGEATAISDWVMESLTGTKRSDRIFHLEKKLKPEQLDKLNQVTSKLLTQEPVQYVLNEAWFCGMRFYVDANVLIPRPETEEMVEWVITNLKFPLNKLSILDIGTGSGCIPISLKRKLRKAEIKSCDVSEKALAVAKKNAALLGADIDLVQLDFLDTGERNKLPSFDIIISNPPYVPEADKDHMAKNVLDHEPYTALFVPDNDALIFYRAIADFGKEHLNKNGVIYLEIHEMLGKEVLSLLHSSGYTAELKKDMQGKDRIVRAYR